jgi:hypothetical protein
MDTPRPVLEIVGDWTSPRLLVRLMVATDSPWELTEQGLRSSETGDLCTVTMRGPDPKLPAAFRKGDHPAHPSILDELVPAIEGHHSVLRITPDPALQGDAAALAAVRCADGLVNVGGLAVWCPHSGAAHSGDRFQERMRELDALQDEVLQREVLGRLLVRPLVDHPQRWHTQGMDLLGGPDAACPRDLSDVVALELLGQAVASVLVGRPPAEGREVRIAGRAEVYRATLDRSTPPKNPFGTVWLAPESGGAPRG